METRNVQVLGMLLALYAELEGMKASNKERELNGQSLAYNEHHFCEKAQEIRDQTNELFK